MRTPNFTNLSQRLRNRDQRGAALVEFAIAIPILFALIAIIFDAGIGYSAARSSSSAARSAARVGAIAGDTRLADYRALSSLQTQFGNGDTVQWIYIYLSDPGVNTTGAPPDPCPLAGTSAGSGCSKYPGSVLATLDVTLFTIDNSSGVDACGAGSPDLNWCPINRRIDDGKYYAVQVESTRNKTIGVLDSDPYMLQDRAVFALYFPPLPTAATPPTPPTN